MKYEIRNMVNRIVAQTHFSFFIFHIPKLATKRSN